MINSEKYWNHIFDQKNEFKTREKQTIFFVNLAIDNLPKWITEDISFEKMTICDAGCAEGGATQRLSEVFDKCEVVGIDFSEKAVECAKKLHPACSYSVGDVNKIGQNYDVIFTSNVLEHFYNHLDVMQRMMKYSNKYFIMLVPFREYYTISEHFSYFDFQSFPLEMGNHALCYYKPMTMQGEQCEYWFGEQILVVYVNKNYMDLSRLNLRNMYNGYIEERTSIIKDYDCKLEAKAQEIADITRQLGEYERQGKEQFAAIEDYKQQITNIQAELNNVRKSYDKEKVAKLEALLLQSQKELQDAETYHREQLEQLESKYKSELDSKIADINSLNGKVKELDQQIQNYQLSTDLLSVEQENIGNALYYIQQTQQSKAYKWSLCMRRFLAEFIHGSDRKDFMKWFACKIFHKQSSKVKVIQDFDYLQNAKHELGKKVRFEGMPLNVSICQNDNVVMKDSRKIFIFASVPFFDVGGGQRSAQLARVYNSMGYQVYYIYGFPCTEADVQHMDIPTQMHAYIDEITVNEVKNIIQKDSIFIFEIPYIKFEPYLDLAKRYDCDVVYEHIDNWDSTLGCLFYDEKVFEHFLDKADHITVTAKMLGEKLQETRQCDYTYCANAVNTELFEPMKTYEKPDDLVIGKRKTLIYFGSLWGEWFDWSIIEYIAKNCPDCAINLIGDNSQIQDRVKSMPSNVHFLGLKKQSTLPSYLAYSDITLLPFKNCDIGAYVSPLKIFEYIAMNKLVLATPLDDIHDYPNTICSDDPKEWVKVIEEEHQLVDISSFITNNSWYARCNAILDLCNHDVIYDDSVSIVVLNRNNYKVIIRCIETLLNHCGRYNTEIIVVDNQSTDGSYEYIKEHYGDRIKVVRNEVNGCSSGRNLGVKESAGKYIMFLDSDQWIISDRWMDTALEIIKNHVLVGAVAWNAGWFNPGQVNGPIVDYLPNRGIEESGILYRKDVAYLATSGFLIERKLFDEVGGFDEFYDPTCYEDTDISLKVRNAGFEIVYSPYMAIMHLPHQTTKSGSDAHTKLMKRNGDYFVNKWKDVDPTLLEYYLY